MATKQLQGSASLAYTPRGGSHTVHLLAAPFKDLELVDVRSRYEWWSGDESTREVVVVGDAVVEDQLATIRFENEPGKLKALLRAGLEDDVPISYYETENGPAFEFWLETIVGSRQVALRPDRKRFGHGEYEVRIHLRKISEFRRTAQTKITETWERS